MVPPGLLLFLVMQELLRLVSALLESSSNRRLHLINTFPSRLHKQSPGPSLFFFLPIPSRKTKKKDKCLVLHHLFNTQTTLLTQSFRMQWSWRAHLLPDDGCPSVMGFSMAIFPFLSYQEAGSGGSWCWEKWSPSQPNLESKRNLNQRCL